MKFFSKISIYLLLVTSVFINNNCKKDNDDPASVTDIDGNVYNMVTIGSQVWMKENLKATKYANGDPIPNVSDGTQWKNLTEDAFCYYDNNVSTANTYGLLYNWYAVSDSREICPEGWRVPDNNDWNELVSFLGGEDFASDILKETGTAHWTAPNSGASDKYGFTALPGGYRLETFNPPGYYAIWWSATPEDLQDAFIFTLIANNSKTYLESQYKKAGHAVRCIKE